MGAALVILVLVAAGGRADVATRSVAPALEHAARRPVTISVREVELVHDEAEAARRAALAKVDVVVEVGWRASDHQHVSVHLHGRDGRLLRASELDFGPSEPHKERGRAIGFAVATMLDDEPVAASILASTAAAESGALVAFPETHVADEQAENSDRPAPPSSSTPPAMAPGARVARRAERPAATVAAEPRFALEGAGGASADARGAATGLGPVLRLQWNAVRDLGVRVGGRAQWFTVNGSSATELGALAGVLWTFARGRHLAAAVRAEAAILNDSFTELVSGTNPVGKTLPARGVVRTGWAPSLAAGIEGDWRASRAAALFLALSAEASTRTIAAAAPPNAPSAMWASLEAGLRVSF